MPQPEFARTIVKMDGRVSIMYPWDFPTNAQAPYVQYAVTALDSETMLALYLEAEEKDINWFGLPDGPFRTWL